MRAGGAAKRQGGVAGPRGDAEAATHRFQIVNDAAPAVGDPDGEDTVSRTRVLARGRPAGLAADRPRIAI